MKKSLAILLVLVLAFSLFAFACTNTGTGTTPSPASSPVASAVPSSAVTASAAPVSPAATGSASSPAVAPSGNTVGYVTDNVDWNARSSYHIVYYNYQPSNVTGQTEAALEQLGQVYNFTIEQLTANNDSDAYINNLTTILLKKPDGLIIDITQELAPRVSEILSQYNIPAVCLFNNAADANGHTIIPSVILDQYYDGQRSMDYLNSVYQSYWGSDVNPSDIGLLVLDYSTNEDLTTRGQGASDEFKKIFGANAPYFYGDTAAGGMSPDSGASVTNSIIAAHPEVKYWFIFGTVEDITLGATRAVESLGLDDNVLMASSGAATLPSQWDSGYNGCWIANYACTPMQYAGTAIFGLLALIDGRATNATLWSNAIQSGDSAARLILTADMMTHDNYKEYTNNIDEGFGVNPNS